jgi:hypothetical protein
MFQSKNEGRKTDAAIFHHPSSVIGLSSSVLRPYFAVPFGDMMLSGNFGMLAAAADLLPELKEPIRKSLQGKTGIAPWELES